MTLGNKKTVASLHYKLPLILPCCCASVLTICQCFFLLVYLYCQCSFVLSCWCCCCYILSFPVGFYCLYLLRKVPLPHSICLIFWGFVLNYISLAILTSFSQHLLLLLLLWQKLKSTKIHTTVPRQQYCVLTGENKNPIQ